MSEHMMPNPMPENLRDKKSVEAHLDAMQDAEMAEKDSIGNDLEHGFSSQEILENMGGEREARNIVGDELTADLVGRRILEMESRGDAFAEEVEKRLSEGESPQEVLDHFGTEDQARLVIGDKVTDNLKKLIDNEKAKGRK